MISRIGFLMMAALISVSCEKDVEKAPKPASKSSAAFPKRSDIEVSEADGLTRRIGSSEPFTGEVVMSKGARVGYFATYEAGKQHGPEIRFHPDGGTLKQWYDWVRGEKVRSREFYENGQIKRDAMMKNGEAYGKHQTWTEEGMLKFDGGFVENLQWHGRVRDLDAEGNVIWDAEFDRGKYLRGVYPKDAEADLIRRGLIDPETKKPTNP